MTRSWPGRIRKPTPSARVAGLLSVDTFVSGPGEAMIVAAYDSEDDFNAASDTIMAILGEMGQFMSSAPMTSSGTVDWTSRT